MADKKKILITGAAGRIGKFLLSRLNGQYDLVLVDKKNETLPGDLQAIQLDIANYDAVRQVFQGQDIQVVVHLAADPRLDAPWEVLLPTNIIGTYNVFEAASQAHCQRVVFASSINAIDGYPPDIQIRADMPVRPPQSVRRDEGVGRSLGSLLRR